MLLFKKGSVYRVALVAVTCLALLVALTAAQEGDVVARSTPTFPDLYEASIAELQAGLEKGHFTSVDLVKVR